MPEIQLTPKQREMVRHALGFDQTRGKKESFRNHYVTDAEGEDGKPWQDLVARGLAHRGPPSELTGGDDVFWCTRELALAVREPDEHLSRGFHE